MKKKNEEKTKNSSWKKNSITEAVWFRRNLTVIITITIKIINGRIKSLTFWRICRVVAVRAVAKTKNKWWCKIIKMSIACRERLKPIDLCWLNPRERILSNHESNACVEYILSCSCHTISLRMREKWRGDKIEYKIGLGHQNRLSFDSYGSFAISIPYAYYIFHVTNPVVYAEHSYQAWHMDDWYCFDLIVNCKDWERKICDRVQHILFRQMAFYSPFNVHVLSFISFPLARGRLVSCIPRVQFGS